MTYIKLLTVLAGLALLTACGGAAATKTDNTGGDTTTDCETNAFHADCDTHPNVTILRIDTCSGDNDIHSTCGAIITSFCTENPHRTFAGVCTGDDYLPLRIADCIEGGKADGANCRQITKNATKNTTLIACLENPFDVACESVPDFMSSFALARTNRLTFCDNSDNATNDLCTGDNVTPICEFDQFTAICPDATYGTPRQEACLMDIETDPSCTGEMGIVTLFCKADPFSTETACMADTYLPDRIADCITTENTGETKCDTLTSDSAMNTMITDCLTNPFATACESVSAFSSSFALARTNRASFCNDNMNVANALCTDDNVGRVCGFDPFTAICFTGDTYATPRQTACLMDIMEDDSCRGDMGLATVFCKASPFDTSNACMADTFLPERLADCITTENTGDMKCDTLSSDNAKNTAITACLTNPFADACASNADFMTYAETAQTNRVSFCDMAGNDTNARCMGANVMGVCVIDPFNAICFAGDTYATPRQTACLLSLDADDICLGEMGIATVFCKANPFDNSVGCTEHPDTPDLQVASCLDVNNMNKDPSCTELLLVNHADFKAYYANYVDIPRTPSRRLHPTPTTTTDQAGFVEGTATSLPTDGLTFSGAQFAPITVRLGEAATGDDGFAIMIGVTTVGNNARFRAGLLSGTDLGPPVPTTSTATWAGSLHFANGVSGHVRVALEDETAVTVDFDNGTIKAPAVTVVSDRTIAIDGLFRAGSNNNGLPVGVLGGTVLYTDSGSPSSLPLIGLIGTEGAIGIYHGSGIIGGFQASPSE